MKPKILIPILTGLIAISWTQGENRVPMPWDDAPRPNFKEWIPRYDGSFLVSTDDPNVWIRVYDDEIGIFDWPDSLYEPIQE